jgi:putative copper export protein
VGLGIALAVVDGFGQHAASFRPEGLGLAVHALHLLAMAVWLGCASLALALRRRVPAAAFTRLVGLALGGVAVSGIPMALVHIPSLQLSPYLEALAGKQLLLAVALAMGWLGRRGGHPRLHWVDAGALGLIIGAAGLLVSLPPPR